MALEVLDKIGTAYLVSKIKSHVADRVTYLTNIITDDEYVISVALNELESRLQQLSSTSIGVGSTYVALGQSINTAALKNEVGIQAQGSAVQPVYFTSSGIAATSYSLEASVPVDAVFTDTHYTTGLKVGSSASSTENAPTINGATYINVIDDTVVRDSHNVVGTGSVTVTSSANGTITIHGAGSEIDAIPDSEIHAAFNFD